MPVSNTSRVTVHLVPHTHWDREWYEPFQRFRLRLVDLLTDVLARAEADPRFHFTLDGQLAAVDDHLEVRPEDTGRVAALVGRGQLAIGPWLILADEFCCSGENLVRNLELGTARAEALGGAMPVGYLPDMFGHCAQMPQILRRAGLDHACLWRGVPSAVDAHAFRWRAPDGSAVRCEYLPGGYGNAAYLLADAGQVAARTAEFVDRMRPWFGDDPVLAMYGTDHSAPLPTLLERVSTLEGADSPYRLEVCTLADYLALFDPAALDDLPGWDGELRSHARANILPGILSVRGHLKRAMADAERMVERYAEPWAALWSEQWPARFLDMAWQRLVASSCHDSVTGCGVDETAVQVAARLAEAGQLGQAVRDRVVAGLAATVPGDAVLVLNPSPADRSGLVWFDAVPPEGAAGVVLELPDGSTVPTQEVGRPARELFTGSFGAAALREAIIRRSFGQEMFNRRIQRWERADRTVTFHVGRAGDPTFDIDAAAEEIDALATAAGGSWTLRIMAEPVRSLLAAVAVPALGWTAARPVAGTARHARTVYVGQSTLDNGGVLVSVNADGTLRIAGPDGTVLDGVGRIVDGGDAGDTYNYAPPGRDSLIDRPVSVTVEPAEEGPLLGALVVTRMYRWPTGLAADRGARSAETVLTAVAMRVELRVGEPFVRLSLDFENRCVDHRTRLHLPLPAAADCSYAEGQFAVVRRGLTSEGGYGEEPVPTFPASSFVDAGQAAVLLPAMTEYELVDGGRELALTLLRATGQISRSVHPYREEPAGPEIPTPLAQSPGIQSIRMAVLPHAGTWAGAGVAAAAERYRHDLLAVPGSAAPGGPLAAAGGLVVGGRGVTMTSLRRRGERLELRLVAYSDTPTSASVAPVTGARRADLLGRPGDALPVTDGTLTLPLAPWEIATVQLSR